MASRKMHQTTVRFGPDLWAEIDAEARAAGVSVAQYLRDSALVRLAYTRGRDGDPHFEAALEALERGAGVPAAQQQDAPSRRKQRLEARMAAEPMKQPPGSASGD